MGGGGGFFSLRGKDPLEIHTQIISFFRFLNFFFFENSKKRFLDKGSDYILRKKLEKKN